MSDTILWIARSSSQAKFLRDFYSFTTILDTGESEILIDNPGDEYDVAIIRNLDNTSGVLLWIVDNKTKKLIPNADAHLYTESYLAYKSLSSTELLDIASDTNVVYDYNFFPDKFFYNFHVANFKLQSYNSGKNIEMILDIFTEFKESLDGEDKRSIPQDNFHTYSIVF